MSKLVALVVFSVLIGIGVIAGAPAAHRVSGMKNQASLSQQTWSLDSQFESDRAHGCHSESYYDPADD